MVLDPYSGHLDPLLMHCYSDSFHGCNELFFGTSGDLYFTEQGQSGLHQPDGRVYRLDVNGKLDCLVSGCLSPNGVVLNAEETQLYVAMVRGHCVWRLPFMDDGGVSKVVIFTQLLFIQLSGGHDSPDGLALHDDGGLVIGHVGMGCAWSLSALGEPAHCVVSTGRGA